jgi:hypothetical protein
MADKRIKVKLVKSTAGCKQSHRDTVRGLGLKRMHHTHHHINIVGASGGIMSCPGCPPKSRGDRGSPLRIGDEDTMLLRQFGPSSNSLFTLRRRRVAVQHDDSWSQH